MTTVINPNEIIITIATSIPGYQKIKYTPSMTIKDIGNNNTSIYFDPLVKLNKSLIDKIPEDIRKKQFFNKGLFESLINYTNSNPANSLGEATFKGYIDNNIKLTLNTIFTDNSIIYVAGKPYVIADVQWSNGDWKIDTKKKKEQFDSTRIRDPYLYQTVVRDEIISGEQQLQNLESNIVYGPNFIGPKNTNDLASGIKTQNANKEGENSTNSNEKTQNTNTITENASSPINPIKNDNQISILNQSEQQPTQVAKNENALIVHSNQVKPIKPIKPPKPIISREIISYNPRNNQQNIPLVESGQTQLIEKQIEPEILQETKHNPQKPLPQLPPVVEPPNKLKVSIRTTETIKNIFSGNYYNLINEIYKVSNEETKEFIQENLKETTSINIKKGAKNLSDSSYKESVSGIRTIENRGGGDCFFIAVADAINYYNFQNQRNRIISGRYGSGTNIYTQMYLREIVFDFITQWPDLDTQLQNTAPVNADNLNEMFSKTLRSIQSEMTDEISSEKYVDLVNDIYKSNDNFLVNSVTSIPIDIDDYDKPFRVIEKSQLRKYILSNNYWANYVAIFALSTRLKLNIIPISNKIGANGKKEVSIPFANFTSEYNNWNKYLFLYYSNGHYELITFNYKSKSFQFQEKNTSITSKLQLSKKIIFKRHEIPPIYILFTIFASYYSNIQDEEDKLKFTFNQPIMKLIEDTINTKLYNTPDYEKNFYPLFKTYFPYSNIKPPQKPTNNTSNNQNNIVGGYNSYNRYNNPYNTYNPYNPYNPYNRYNPYSYRTPYMAQNIVKKDNVDNSQLAYYVTVYMELHPGTTITPAESKTLKCRQKWNSIRKAYADMVGKPYIIPPVYQPQPVKETKQNITNKNYKRPLATIKNNTRKRVH